MKFYTLSPSEVPENPHLFPMWTPTWIASGCSIVDKIEECDVVLMDLHSRLIDYNQQDVDILYGGDRPIITFDEWDRGNMSSDNWPNPLTKQQKGVFTCIDALGVKSAHFCRLLDKTKIYAENLYPYEKPILHEGPLLTPDELFNREFDVVFIANQSPSRERIAESFQRDIRLKTFISIGAKKREFSDFLNWHKRGKLFVSSGAGGYTDERKQALFSIAGIIQEETNQLLLHKFYDGLNCIKIDNPPTKEQFDTIYEVVNNKEKLYEIYYNCYHYMKKYYSAEYIANDILSKIKQHLL